MCKHVEVTDMHQLVEQNSLEHNYCQYKPIKGNIKYI